MEFLKEDVEKHKFTAAICYVSLLFILPLLLIKDSDFVKAHAKQGLVLFLFEVLGTLIYYFPIFGKFLGSLILLIAFFISLIGIVAAIDGIFIEFPVIFDLSREIKI